jgi:hypothetical protein
MLMRVIASTMTIEPAHPWEEFGIRLIVPAEGKKAADTIGYPGKKRVG